MQINEIESKQILGKNKLPGMGYCLNPYVGCQHLPRILQRVEGFIMVFFHPESFFGRALRCISRTVP